MATKIRPAVGDSVTLLFEIDGVPVSDVGKATRVRDASMIVPRGDLGIDGEVVSGSLVTVVFVHDRRLCRWHMRIEEILPSSYFLVSVREPGAGDRREFVRAAVEMTVRIAPKSGGAVFEQSSPMSISAAGVRLPIDLPYAIGINVDLALTSAEGVVVSGGATVVRSDEGGTALEFVELTSAAENRLIDLVFQARSANLQARMGIDLS